MTNNELEEKIIEVLNKYKCGTDQSPSFGFDILRWARSGYLQVNTDAVNKRDAT